MKEYELQKNLINSIKKRHIDFFGWVGLGNTFKTPKGQGYYMENKYPKLDVKGMKEKAENLKKVLKFYYFLKKNLEVLHTNGINLETPPYAEYKIKPHQIYIFPDDKSGVIYFAYGKYIDRNSTQQMYALIDDAKEKLKETNQKLKELEKEVKVNKENLLIY